MNLGKPFLVSFSDRSHSWSPSSLSNFLDRDALGGLATAIRDWAGAVVIISHNEEFVGALCAYPPLQGFARLPMMTSCRPRNLASRGGPNDS